MKPEYIIIHHSATRDGRTVSWQAIREYHMQQLGWRAIGYHYGIELVNHTFEILKGRYDNETGAHCKQARMNVKSIGICLVGDFDAEEPDTVMMYKLIQLTRSLMGIYSIPIERVMPHRMFARHKSCPGKNFDFDRFADGLRHGEV
jgi:hypothetical protein